MINSASYTPVKLPLQTLQSTTSLFRSNASNISDKSYRDSVISANILQKATQLYNEITAASQTTEAAFTRANNYLTEIQDKGLQEALNSYITTDTRSAFQIPSLGNNVDVNE